MKTLEACCLAFGWQGGTLHNAIKKCKTNGRIGSSAYMLGLRMGLDDLEGFDNIIGSADIPVASFGSPDVQIPDYVLGLINSGRFSRYDIQS